MTNWFAESCEKRGGVYFGYGSTICEGPRWWQGVLKYLWVVRWGSPMDQQQRVEAVKGVIASLFASQRALRALAPEYKWKGLGNLLGDFGEFVAVTEYGFVKATAGSNGYDAKTPDGKSVQVKTNHAASQIGFRGQADLMLVLHVRDSGDWEEIYFGPFELVKKASRRSERDNKDMIAISKLRELKKVMDSTKPGISAKI